MSGTGEAAGSPSPRPSPPCKSFSGMGEGAERAFPGRPGEGARSCSSVRGCFWRATAGDGGEKCLAARRSLLWRTWGAGTS